MANNQIPENVNKWLLDRLIAGKQTDTKEKGTILWWAGLSQEQKEEVKIIRESEKFASKYDRVVGSLSFVLIIIGGIYIARTFTTDTFMSILLMVLNIMIAVVIAAIIMLTSNKLLYRFKYTRLQKGN